MSMLTAAMCMTAPIVCVLIPMFIIINVQPMADVNTGADADISPGLFGGKFVS